MALPFNLIFGGITGLIGSITTSITNYKIQKLKNEHEVIMVKENTKAMIAETEANIKVTQVEAEAAIELADSHAYLKSIELGNKNMFSQKWIDKLFSVTGWVKFIAIPVGVLIAFLFGIFLKPSQDRVSHGYLLVLHCSWPSQHIKYLVQLVCQRWTQQLLWQY